ncbi:protein C-terminal S-isoprenylcysteine carboxyl O-methyltransferase [Wolffia australiana]
MGTATFIAHSPLPPRRRAADGAARASLLSPPSLFSLPSTSSPFGGEISLRPSIKHLPGAARTKPLSPFQPSALPFSFSSPVDLPEVTPLKVCKWAAVGCALVAAARRAAAAALNPFFWTYFSWCWLFWPWILAATAAIYGVYCLRKHANGGASYWEQVAVVTSSVLWLTLVGPAHFNGYLEGWPIVFFLVYHYFFFFESTVRRRLYGDLSPRQADPRWAVRVPSALRLGFAGSVLAGHWLAAWEGPELHLGPGGWANAAIWVLILAAIFMRYHAILYAAKYSEKVTQPSAVARFGPYRWVRHPVYASTMALFAAYCSSLGAPISCLLLVGVCAAYYGRKAELEEKLMAEAFGTDYAEYAAKVRYKLIPFLF